MSTALDSSCSLALVTVFGHFSMFSINTKWQHFKSYQRFSKYFSNKKIHLLDKSLPLRAQTKQLLQDEIYHLVLVVCSFIMAQGIGITRRQSR